MKYTYNKYFEIDEKINSIIKKYQLLNNNLIIAINNNLIKYKKETHIRLIKRKRELIIKATNELITVFPELIQIENISFFFWLNRKKYKHIF